MDKCNLKVTIMIPTFEQEEYILKCVYSALAQTYKNLEVIVSDDSHSDNTKNILSGISDPRFKYFKNNVNLGRVRNYRQLLYELSSGDYVINLDGDDYFIDDKFIENSISLVNSYENVVIVSAGYVSNYENGLQKYFKLTNNINFLDGKQQLLEWGNHPLPHLTTIYSRKHAMGIGFYSMEIQSSDWESLLRLCSEGNVLLLPNYVAVWRKHEGNESIKINIELLRRNNALIDSVLKHWSKILTVKEQVIWRQSMKDVLCRNSYYTIIEHGRISDLKLLVIVYGLGCFFRLIFSFKAFALLSIRIFFGKKLFSYIKNLYLLKKTGY